MAEVKMAEVKYVCQVKLTIIRQVEFVDEAGLQEAFVKENAESVAQVEWGRDFDEVELLGYEEHPFIGDGA